LQEIYFEERWVFVRLDRYFWVYGKVDNEFGDKHDWNRACSTNSEKGLISSSTSNASDLKWNIIRQQHAGQRACKQSEIVLDWWIW